MRMTWEILREEVRQAFLGARELSTHEYLREDTLEAERIAGKRPQRRELGWHSPRVAGRLPNHSEVS